MNRTNQMNKKGVSVIIGYVLLIVIAISLALLVYAWMKGNLPKEKQQCPDEVSLVIKDYNCFENGKINITLKNNGFFDIDGFIAKISNKSKSLPILALKGVFPVQSNDGQFIFGVPMNSSQEFTETFDYSNHNLILDLQIMPLKRIGNKLVLCENSVIRQKLDETSCANSS